MLGGDDAMAGIDDPSAGDVNVTGSEEGGILSDTSATTGALVNLGSVGAGEGICEVLACCTRGLG